MSGQYNWNARLNMADMHNIVPGLFLGSQEAAMDLVNLEDNKISHILIVGDQLHKCFPEKLKYHHIEIMDMPSSDLISHFHTCAKFIDEGIQSGGVLVHCAMGISRSSTIVIAYLMEKQKLSYLEALNFTQQKRTFISPNYGFRKQLQLFEKLNCLIEESNAAEIQTLMSELDSRLY